MSSESRAQQEKMVAVFLGVQTVDAHFCDSVWDLAEKEERREGESWVMVFLPVDTEQLQKRQLNSFNPHRCKRAIWFLDARHPQTYMSRGVYQDPD